MSEVMDSFYNALHNLDVISVKQSKHESLIEIENGKDYCFYIKNIDNPLDCADGDVLCGFYSENEETFKVKIGNTLNGSGITQECKTNKTNNRMVLPFNNSIIPLIKLVYHKVEIDNPNIYGVFACLCHEMRKFLVNNTFYIDDYVYQSGMFDERPKYNILPKFEPFIRTVIMEPLTTKTYKYIPTPEYINEARELLKSGGFTDITFDNETGISCFTKEGTPITFGPTSTTVPL